MKRFTCIILLGATLLGGCKPSTPASGNKSTLTIAAAADLKYALDELVKAYRGAHPGVDISVSYGSSGNFFAQIENKAPFDLYFSADVEYPRKLAKAGHALDDDVFLYAVGRIVVWAPNNYPGDVRQLGFEALKQPAVKRIAIANPQHAPYGRAAVAAMKTLKVHDALESKFVYGENIAQTAQFVQSGAADMGVIALSLALAPQMAEAGSYWEIPLESYPRMEQGGLVLKQTQQPEVARSFRDFVLGKTGRELLKRYGFFLPEK